MSAGHDDCKLDLDTEFEEPNETSGNSLVGLGVDGGKVGRRVKDVHSVGSRLNREGISTTGG